MMNVCLFCADQMEWMIGSLLLGLKAWLVAYPAWLWVKRAGLVGWAEKLMAMGLLAAALIIVLTQALGYLGLLGNIATLVGHGAVAGCTVYWVLRRGGAGLTVVTADCGNTVFPVVRRIWRSVPWELRWVAFVALLLTVALMVIAVVARSFDFDSNSYRLPRIGLWIQSGHIGHVPTNDARMNYAAIGGDLLMYWVVSSFGRGFPATALLQWAAGMLLIVATWAFIRRMGGSIPSAITGTILLLGMPVMVAQMTTDQVDLLVAAFATAGGYFVVGGTLQQSTIKFALGALGLSLALATKGTAFYLLPGWGIAWLLLAGKLATVRLLLPRFALLSVVAFAVIASPRYLENAVHYGNPFGNEADLERNSGGGIFGFSAHRLAANSWTYLAQLLTPDANPGIPGIFSRAAAERIALTLPQQPDPWSAGKSRAGFVASLLNEPGQWEPALFSSTGWMIVALAATGLMLQLRRGPHPAHFPWKRAFWPLAVVCLCFHLVFASWFNWWPMSMRFYLLVAPFLAVFAALGLDQLSSPKTKRVMMAAAAALALAAGWQIFATGQWSGIGNLLNRERVLVARLHAAQSAALGLLPVQIDRLGVCLPDNSMLAQLTRHPAVAHTILVQEDVIAQFDNPVEAMDRLNLDALLTTSTRWPKPQGPFQAWSWTGIQGSPSYHDFILFTPILHP